MMINIGSIEAPSDVKISSVNEYQTPSAITYETPGIVNKAYLQMAPPYFGILRFGIILCLFGGWVSMAAAIDPKLVGVFEDSRYKTYLVFSVIGFVISSIIFAVQLLNYTNKPVFSVIFKTLVLAVHDVIYTIIMFVLGITAAIKESQIPLPYSYPYRIGAFACASAYALISAILYGLLAVLEFRNNQF